MCNGKGWVCLPRGQGREFEGYVRQQDVMCGTRFEMLMEGMGCTCRIGKG